MALLNWLLDRVTTRPCKYLKRCKYASVNNPSCQTESYRCGTRRELEATN